MGKQKGLLLAAIVVLLFSIGAGVSYARYITTVKKQQQFQYQTTPNISLAAAAGQGQPEWIRTGKQAELPFAVQCRDASAEHGFALYLVASGQANTPAYVTLTAGGETYYASEEEIPPNSVLYNQVGSGYVYRFYDDANQEILWNVGSIHGESRTFLLTAANLHASTLLELFVAESH